MNTIVIAWVMLLLFALINNYVIFRLLKQRSRTDLMWISAVATIIPIALFAIWPGALSLMSFPLIQSVGMFLIIRLVGRQS